MGNKNSTHKESFGVEFKEPFRLVKIRTILCPKT